MINYIIIENEMKYREKYINIIKEVMKFAKIKYKIDEFSKCTEELKKIVLDTNSFKVYLIDICLDCKNTGIDIAKQIRTVDTNSEIIFITSQELMFETVFKNVRKVYSFIYKYNNMEQELQNELKDIVNNYSSNINYFWLDKKGNSKVNINDILYIYRETAERKIYLVTKDNKYPTYITLKDILDKYKDYFYQVHRACLVNPKQVNMYNWNEGYFILKTNTKVFMCSKKYKDYIV